MVHLPGSVPLGWESPQIPGSWSSAEFAAMFPFGIVVRSKVPRPLVPSDSTSWRNTLLADTKPSRSSRCSCMPGLVPSTQRPAVGAWLHVSSCVFPLHEICPEKSRDFSRLLRTLLSHARPSALGFDVRTLSVLFGLLRIKPDFLVDSLPFLKEMPYE